MSRDLCPNQHNSHFGDESFQAITCTGIKTRKNTSKTQNKQKINKLARGKKKH